MAPSSLSFFAKAVAGMIVFFVILAIAGNIVVHYYPTVSGHYSYIVSVTGLSGYQGGSVTEIVVPVPAIRGSPIFSDEELQRIGFSGNWTSLPVTTQDGVMLALRSQGRDLANTSGVISHDFSEDPSGEVLQEVYVPTASRLFEAGNTSDEFPYIIIPDTLRPASNTTSPISVRIDFNVMGSTTFGEKKPDYRISLVTQIPPGTTGIIPIEPEIYYRNTYTEQFRPLDENNVSVT